MESKFGSSIPALLSQFVFQMQRVESLRAGVGGAVRDGVRSRQVVHAPVDVRRGLRLDRRHALSVLVGVLGGSRIPPIGDGRSPRMGRNSGLYITQAITTHVTRKPSLASFTSSCGCLLFLCFLFFFVSRP